MTTKPCILSTSTQFKWKQLSCIAKNGDPKTTNFPSPRCGHSLSIVGSNIYIFGGLSENSSSPNNDLFLFRLRCTGQSEWERVILEEIPPSRWRHTATQINKTEILVFGGFSSASMHDRVDDVWAFNVITLKWKKIIPKVADEDGYSGPCPRGHHTANVIGNEVYIFGGHGGNYFERRCLNDLHSLNTDTWAWKKIVPSGLGPECRSGHCACVIGLSLYVFGGQNSERSFCDLYILDTSSSSWTKIDPSLPMSMWNHAGLEVNETIFVFGGRGGDDDFYDNFSNDTLVLDPNSKKWHLLPIVGKMPEARSDTDMVYFEKESNIVVFGGWANKWFCDLWLLDVSSII